MTPFTTLARDRRSIRRYTTTPISREVITALVETATWAPSAHNRQPWRFAVVNTPEKQISLARAMGAKLRVDLMADQVPNDVIEKDVSRSYDRITGAAALICLCLTMEDMDTYPDAIRNQHEWTMAVQSTAMAGQNLLLAAHEHGLGACWMCAPLFCSDVVRNVLALPNDWQPQSLIGLGYPAQERTKTRKAAQILWR